MKGYVRVGGALFLGILVILGAFFVRDNSRSVADGAIVAMPAPERTAIQTRDSNNNGIEDWEENLEGKIFEAITVPTSANLIEVDDEPYETPTTLTGKFSEAFMQDYLEGKMAGQDFSDPSALVGSAVSAIDASTGSRKYTRLQVIQIPTTKESVSEYGNRLGEIMATHSIQNENEAAILQKALTADDPKILEALAPIHDVYEKILRDALIVPVPEILTDEHVAYLNALEAIKTDVSAMQVAFTDPLYALARIRGYETDAGALLNALQTIGKSVGAEGVTYRNDEPGAVFYLFDI